MANILIVYGSTEGHTAKVALHLAAAAQGAGHAVHMTRDSEAQPQLDPAQYDAAIITGSVHYSKFQKPLTGFVRAHAAVLNTKPSAFFAVSGAACDPNTGRADAQRILTDPFLATTGWKPQVVEQVAGAFPFTTYPWWKRMVMKIILKRGGQPADTKTDYVYTDWNAVDAAVTAFLKTLR